MNQNLRVRRMEVGDLLRAAALEQSSFSQPWSEKLLAEGLNSPLFFTIGKFDFRRTLDKKSPNKGGHGKQTID